MFFTRRVSLGGGFEHFLDVFSLCNNFDCFIFTPCHRASSGGLSSTIFLTIWPLCPAPFRYSSGQVWQYGSGLFYPIVGPVISPHSRSISLCRWVFSPGSERLTATNDQGTTSTLGLFLFAVKTNDPFMRMWSFMILSLFVSMRKNAERKLVGGHLPFPVYFLSVTNLYGGTLKVFHLFYKFVTLFWRTFWR